MSRHRRDVRVAGNPAGRRRRRAGWPVAALSLGCLAACAPATAAPGPGSWRLMSAVPAPWVTSPAAAPASKGLQGSTIEFLDGRIAGPSPLGCANAVYEFVVSPAEGLFQGGLTAPAEVQARTLGISHLPVLTLSVTCDTGIFDFHYAAPDRLLIALDNAIWSLAPVAPARGPAAVVQALLAEHMTGPMEFSAETVARKERYLSPRLAAAIAGYFRRPHPVGEPPPINGDPFTDSQEYPSRFSIVDVEQEGGSARVGVRFISGDRGRTVTMVLTRSGDAWLVDDLRYEDGSTFRDLLGPV